MNNVDLKTYLPDQYEGIIEAEAEQDALSIEINKLHERYEQALLDQFVQKASIKAIGYYENIFSIIANPAVETLEFRRERILSRMKSLTPPYTRWYLRKALDTFYGKDNYDLQIDVQKQTITVESSASNSLWYHEIQVSMTAVKPCNMIYINIPRITNTLLVNETVSSGSKVYNYKLDGTWRLGLRPFISISNEEVQKMPQVKSVTNDFIDKSLAEWETYFKKAKLNDSIEITNLTTKIEDSSVIITYDVVKSTTPAITNIKLLGEADLVLLDSQVFIPIEDSVIIKHKIRLQEGVNG